MTAAKKAAMWAEISRLLKEYEDSQTATIKDEIAKSYDSLRQKMQVVAVDFADDEELQ